MKSDSISSDVPMKTKFHFSTDNQNALAFMRESFLNELSGIVGMEIKIHMYENTVVSGKLEAYDSELEDFLVSDLNTRTEVVPHAKLRKCDIIFFEAEEPATVIQ